MIAVSVWEMTTTVGLRLLPLSPPYLRSHPKVCSGTISCFSLSYKLHPDDMPTTPPDRVSAYILESIAVNLKVYTEVSVLHVSLLAPSFLHLASLQHSET